MTRLMFASALIAASAVGLALTGAGQAAALAQPTYTTAQAARGLAIYTARCAECHGAKLDDGQFGPALKGQAFTQLHQGPGLDRVYAFMMTQMPPTAPGSLSPRAYADVLAYLLSQNNLPASATAELPADEAKLKSMAAPR